MRMPRSLFVFLSFVLLSCALSAFPDAAEAAGSEKKKTSAPAQKKPVAVRPTAAVDQDKLQKDLDIFAKSCVTNMNNHMKPGFKTKQVIKTPEGYRAHYIAVDPDSLSTSFSPSEHKIVPYIGRMMYHEVEYVCLGKTEKEALAGPFNEVNRRPMTELIKYMKGKWTY